MSRGLARSAGASVGRVISGAVAVLLGAPAPLLACATCYGNPSSPMMRGMTSGVVFLLACIGAVLASFAGLFGYWIYRHRRNVLATDGMVH